jgi:Tol biopolymer transport system component
LPIRSGTVLGPYEILAPLGSGGMGEVYRAIDTTLKRAVAIKVLPAGLADDPDRLARFQREAEVLAALNHPNIAAIYGVERSTSVSALVMELVEGPTLADRIAEGPLPLEEALAIARQLALALEAAHARGIIHRDLKPANVKVRDDGTVKVLDFGLAKALEPPAGAAAGSPSMSPTLTSPAMTQIGMLLGTAAYMAPEQAKGRPADKRSDVWAFGCVLYEMLTGRRTFDGDDVVDVLGAVTRLDPDWTAIPATVPPAVRSLLENCLVKDPRARAGDIAVARFVLEHAARIAPPVPHTPAPTSPLWRRTLPWGVAAAALLLAAVLVAARFRVVTPPVATLEKLSADIGADASLPIDQGASAVISPDGHTLAFVAQANARAVSQLYVRPLDVLRAQPLAGTEGARDPIFSPDGRWIGFFADGKLKKVAVTGGATVTIADAVNSRGAVWADDDTIVFQPINAASPGTGALMRVAAAGGTPAPVSPLLGAEVTQRWPQVLPGGHTVLFTSHDSTTAGYEGANIVVQPLAGGERKILVRGGYFARYVPSGHLLYMHEGTLFAAAFDVERLALTGQPVPAVEGIATNSAYGGAQFSVANDGTLVYIGGARIDRTAQMSWLATNGGTSPLRATPAAWDYPKFMPDGRQLVFQIDGTVGNQSDIWIYDWARDALSRLTFDGGSRRPVPTPDGRRIVFTTRRPTTSGTDSLNLYWLRADGTGEVERLTEGPNQQLATSWHPNGRFLAFYEARGAVTSMDLMILPMEGDETTGWKPGTPTVFLSTPANETLPAFSPDGHWIAYSSNESRQAEIYVRPFPGPGGKWQVSTNGGSIAAWSPTANELFYESLDGHIMRVTYTATGDAVQFARPQPINDTRIVPISRRLWAVHPDGKRFAVNPIEAEPAKTDRVVFVFNFFDELRRIAPTGK